MEQYLLNIILQLKNANILKKDINEKDLINEFISTGLKKEKFLYFLYEKKYISKEIYLKILANQYNMKYLLNIDTYYSILETKIPFKFFKKERFLIYKIIENNIYVLIDDYNNINYKRIINQFYENSTIIPILVATNDLTKVLNNLEENHTILEYISNIKEDLNNTSAINEDVNNSSIFQFLQKILEIAINKKTSDIHIEAKENKSIIRFRILGTLEKYIEFDNDIYNALISTIKMLSKLDISNKYVPQDGSFSLEINNKPFDFRVSTLPTIWGESCVIRILNKDNILKKITDIGLDENLEKVEKIINMPNGIFLVTGPTGSGKSTTLYAILNTLDKEQKKIITVEDPVEYKLDDIQQVQVNVKKGLTFANALRSILRQDPDIIMIGEIRDKETLEIAIKAALTGHLVISTLHTNDSISAINRMIDMGVESYLIASALVGVEAQRLVKTICPYCKEPYTPPSGLYKIVKPFFPKDFVFYKGKGCEKCNFTGYSGRMLITEVFVKDMKLEEMIIKEKSKQEILEYLNENNFSTMFLDGIRKVLKHKTTLEEVFRVSKMD